MTKDFDELDAFTQSYVTTALWSTNDNDTGDPLDKKHDWSNIAPKTQERMVEDCAKFQLLNRAVLTDDSYIGKGRNDHSVEEMAGHDFWLTRNGHGAGFWDGDWKKNAERKLDASSKEFGEMDLYVGDDEKIHGVF